MAKQIPTQLPDLESSDTTNTPLEIRKKRVLVVDDHPLVRHGVALLINRQNDLVCCDCEVNRVSDIIAALNKHKPDLLLLDLNLKDGSALPFIGSLKSQFPSVTILVLSQFEEIFCVEEALHAGAAGYVLKEEDPREIVTAIRFVLRQEIYLSHKIAAVVLNQLVGAKKPLSAIEIGQLTISEREVLQLLGCGLSTFEIAVQMKISVKEVEGHRKQLLKKLKLSDYAALTDYAIQHGDNACGDNSKDRLLHHVFGWQHGKTMPFHKKSKT